MNRPKENVSGCEVPSLVAHPWHFRELPELAIEVLKHAVGRIEVVLGNVLPDVLKIAERTPGEFESTHPRCRRRSAV